MCCRKTSTSTDGAVSPFVFNIDAAANQLPVTQVSPEVLCCCKCYFSGCILSADQNACSINSLFLILHLLLMHRATLCLRLETLC